MEFLAPLMLLGVLGASVPVFIHLIGRRRAPVKKFGAIDFLLGQNRRVARHLRLREVVLLVVRVAACLAMPLVLAKPFVSCTASGVAVTRGPQAVVLVIDNSFQMGWRQGGDTLLGEARERARRVLDQLGPEAEVAVIAAAEGSEPPGELSRDHLRVLDAIDATPLTARPADLTLALRRAATLLGTSANTARRVYLFSSLPAAGFAGEMPWPPGSGPELYPVAVSEEPPANLAIVSASAEKDPDLGPRAVQITMEIANFGMGRVDGRGVTVRIGGRSVARGLVTLAPGEKARKQFAVTLPGEARTAEVVLDLDGDSLEIDDRRYLRVELRRDLRVLLVDGDPRTVRHDDELFYLETALRPGDRADSSVVVAATTVDELARRRLSDYDVIFLCNVKPLEPARVAELEAWVRKGGGLFVSLGDNVDADAYNGQMRPLLAQELRSLRQLAAGPKSPDAARAEHLGQLDATHPVLSVFSARAAGLREASFWKVFLLGPSAPGTAERITVAHYGSGAPALVEAKLGAGRLLLYTSTIDRDWNDLPIHPGYLPLMQQTTRYLARSPVQEPDAEIVVGHGREIPVAPEDTRIEVEAPSGKKSAFEAPRLKGRTSLTFTEVDEPGFYHVTATSPAGTRARPAAEFVANLDPRGSDTRRVAATALPVGGGQGPSGVASSVEPPRHRVELWHGVAAALLLFLLGEAVLTRRG